MQKYVAIEVNMCIWQMST